MRDVALRAWDTPTRGTSDNSFLDFMVLADMAFGVGLGGEKGIYEANCGGRSTPRILTSEFNRQDLTGSRLIADLLIVSWYVIFLRILQRRPNPTRSFFTFIGGGPKGCVRKMIDLSDSPMVAPDFFREMRSSYTPVFESSLLVRRTEHDGAVRVLNNQQKKRKIFRCVRPGSSILRYQILA